MNHNENNSETIFNFNLDGVAYLKNFLDVTTLGAINREMAKAEQLALEDLEANWNNEKITFFSKNPVSSITEKNSEDFVVSSYFQESTDKCHIFFEEIENTLVVNRIGHGLHLQDELPQTSSLIYKNQNLHKLLQSLGYSHPVCILSVYIPKHPNGFGSEVRPHQESTFAHTNPLSSLVLWVALEDATIENACMWGLLGSHKMPLKYVSMVDHVQKTRIYRQINNVEIPEFNTFENTYTPLQVNAGDALIFNGNFVHCSAQNKSFGSRKAITFQFVETYKTEFSAFNWIRSPNNRILY